MTMIVYDTGAACGWEPRARRKKRAPLLTWQNNQSMAFPIPASFYPLHHFFACTSNLVSLNVTPLFPTLFLLPSGLIAGSFQVSWLIWMSNLSETAEKQGLGCCLQYKTRGCVHSSGNNHKQKPAPNPSRARSVQSTPSDGHRLVI